MTSSNDLLRTARAPLHAEAESAATLVSDELRSARDASVVIELSSWATLQVAGRDAEAFLQGQLTGDVAALVPDSAQYTAYCSPKGRVLANFVLIRTATDAFELLLPKVLSESLRKRLTLFVLRSQVRLSDVGNELVWLGVGGPAARTAVEKVTGLSAPARPLDVVQGDALVVLRLPGDRYLLRTPSERSTALWQRGASAAHASGLSAWDWLSVRAGVPVILPATQDQFVPQSLNWDALGGISFRKGCYTGQEIVARMQYLGRLKERLFLCHLDADPPLPGERVFSSVFGDQPCGTVVNVAAAPGGGCDLLAVIQVSAVEGEDIHLSAPSGPSLLRLPLPYELPPPQSPRGRIA